MPPMVAFVLVSFSSSNKTSIRRLSVLRVHFVRARIHRFGVAKWCCYIQAMVNGRRRRWHVLAHSIALHSRFRACVFASAAHTIHHAAPTTIMCIDRLACALFSNRMWRQQTAGCLSRCDCRRYGHRSGNIFFFIIILSTPHHGNLESKNRNG